MRAMPPSTQPSINSQYFIGSSGDSVMTTGLLLFPFSSGTSVYDGNDDVSLNSVDVEVEAKVFEDISLVCVGDISVNRTEDMGK